MLTYSIILRWLERRTGVVTPPVDPEEPLAAPVIDEAGSSIAADDAGNVVARIKVNGEQLYSLEVDHNAEGLLPEFTIYADSANVWGTPESASQAVTAGVEATYVDGEWVITFLDGGAAKDVFMTQRGGRFRLVFVAANAEGTKSGSMSGQEYFVLETVVTAEAPAPDTEEPAAE